ncbi:MAG: DUF952 domain-containing protein [Alphaproteobacteria bacterium]
MKRKIYKICYLEEWETAVKEGFFRGSKVDLSDGFIHFSTKDQLKTTARMHFKGQEDLVLIEVDAKYLPLKWEPSRGGNLFPHLYTIWQLNGLEKKWDLFLDENNIPVMPF